MRTDTSHETAEANAGYRLPHTMKEVEITEADLEEDHMEAVSQLLRDMDDDAPGSDVVEPCQNFRYDLCEECHKRFVHDPLGKEQAQKFHFSKN